MATRDDASFVATARDYFESFLLSFSAEPEATLASNMDEPPLPYIEQCNMMRETERTTLFVDFQHLTSYDSELAEASGDAAAAAGKRGEGAVPPP